MNYFSQFVVMFGALLALMTLVTAWLFRLSTAWLGWRLALPVVLVILACWTPWTVSSMMGLPVVSTRASLPDTAQLIAFVPHDEDHVVDLWLLAGGAVPKSYEIALDKRTKKALADAAADLAQGKPVFLKKSKDKDGSSKRQDGKDGDGAPSVTELQSDDDVAYELDRDAMPTLPAKH